MSTTFERITLAQAKEEANDFRDLFSSSLHYWRWEVAGSVRRERPTIGDIEHVVIARPAYTDLMSDGVGNAMKAQAARLVGQKKIKYHDYGGGRMRNGEKLMSLDFNGRTHEVYMCSANNWGCILAIRTGSADFAREMVTRMPGFGHRQQEGHLHQILPSGELQMISCVDEAQFFDAAGLNVADWPPPKRERLVHP